MTSQKGFTLIEIILVMIFIGLVSGLGFNRFSDYSKQQSIDQAAAKVKTVMEKAKFDALSRKTKPAGCNTLQAYSFKVNLNPANTYSVIAKCNNGDYASLPENERLPNPDNITFRNSSRGCRIDFGVLDSAVTLDDFGPCRLPNNPPPPPAICADANTFCIEIRGYNLRRYVVFNTNGLIVVR